MLAGVMAMVAAAPGTAAKPDHAKGHGKHGKSVKHGRAAHDGHVGADHWGARGCPPGLAKKNNGCLPPGQAKKRYNVGQRFPQSYGDRWTYNQIPTQWRNQYGFDPYSNYYYGDGYLYRVDPKTQLISQVISAILR